MIEKNVSGISPEFARKDWEKQRLSVKWADHRTKNRSPNPRNTKQECYHTNAIFTYQVVRVVTSWRVKEWGKTSGSSRPSGWTRVGEVAFWSAASGAGLVGHPWHMPRKCVQPVWSCYVRTDERRDRRSDFKRCSTRLRMRLRKTSSLFSEKSCTNNDLSLFTTQ